MRLRAKWVHARLGLIARVSPCAGHWRAKLQLNRGGKRVAVKLLNGRCVARFHPRVRGRATFRALLSGSVPIRSKRVAVGAAR